MKNQKGFSLVELLIVVAIIAIIAAIAVPSLLTSRMATNESAAIQACRTIGSAEIAYAAVNNQTYTDLATLTAQNYLDARFTGGINGYQFAVGPVVAPGAGAPPAGFQFQATPNPGAGRYDYGIAPDQVVRFIGISATAPAGTVAPVDGMGNPMNPNDPIGKVQ